MGWISEIIKAGRRAGDALRTMGEDQMKDASTQQKDMNEQFGAGRETTTSFGQSEDSTSGSTVKVNGEGNKDALTAAPTHEVATIEENNDKLTGSEKMDSEGMLTSDANCKNLKPIDEVPGKEDTIGEEAEHAKKHFNTMLNGTPDADPSNGLESHNISEKETEAYFGDGDDDVDVDVDSPKNTWKNNGLNRTNPAFESAYTDKGGTLNREDYPIDHEKTDQELSKEARERAKKVWMANKAKKASANKKPTSSESGSLGKTVRDALVTKHVLKAPTLSAGPDSTTGPSEITHFTGGDNAGSKVLLSDEKFKNKVKTGLKSELKSRASNAGKNLSNLNKNQAPNVSFNNNYGGDQDFSLVSDERLKEIFGDDDISCLARINAYDFTYKPEAIERLGDKGMGVDTIEHSGVIAQELENNPMYKGVVTEMPDGTLALKTKELSAANTAAVGELAKAIESIVGRLENIENMLGDRR